MGLAEICKVCNQQTIPIRILGKVVGSDERLYIWKCRECKALWSSN
jgi:hypothetical protein